MTYLSRDYQYFIVTVYLMPFLRYSSSNSGVILTCVLGV